MSSEPNHGVRDLGSARLKLRDDLVFIPQHHGSQAGYLVEDRVQSKFYRIGTAECAFISLLDGQTTISGAVRLAARPLGSEAFSEQEAAAICRWLVDEGLAHTQESAQSERLVSAAKVAERELAHSRWNPLFIRLPLFHPDRWIDKLAPWLGWMHTAYFFPMWLIVGLWAIGQVESQWQRFVASSEGVFAPGNWLWIGLAWVVLKLLHELGHATACKKYGGRVHEAGIILVLFAPVAYVDVTSSWRFKSKWQRIHTAAAGMYVELFVAAIAALMWSRTGPGVVNNLCFNVVLMASLSTLLFNANPLMRFDGYYILSDLIEVPNLYPAGQQSVVGFCRRYLLGQGGATPGYRFGRRVLLAFYGWASLLWRVLVYVCLMIAAGTMFAGAGMLFVVAAVAGWVGPRTVRLVKSVLTGQGGGHSSWRAALLRSGAAAAIVLFLLTGVPWPGREHAPAIVEYAPHTVIRSDSAGFVREVRVQSGEWVEEGQTLAVLENLEIESELRDVDLAIEQSSLKSRVHAQNNELAAYQAELENLAALQKRRAERQEQVDRLTVRAPARGRVVGRNLESLVDAYFKAGAEVMSLGDEESKELRVAIAQEDVDLFTSQVGSPVRVRVAGIALLQGQLTKVTPRATLEPPHPSLGGALGGPLAVRKKNAPANATEAAADLYELVAPRFVGHVELAADQARCLRSGQRGVVALQVKHCSIGTFCYGWLRHWLREKVHHATRVPKPE